MLSIALTPTRSKTAPTALVRRPDGREFYLHSRVDPIAEARFLADDVRVQERTLYVVLGFGLGYHVRDLLERLPKSSHVVVVEPAEACLSAQLLTDGDRHAGWMRDRRLHFLVHHDPKLTPIHLAERMAALRLLAIKMIRHVPSMLTAEDFYGAVANEIQQTLPANLQRHLSAIDQSLENELHNFWANLSRSWNSNPIGRLRGLWRGRPVIIVSGGPSLTDALPLLPALRDRALLLATASTVRILLDAGIRPDLVISVDPFEPNAAHFDGWDGTGIPLVYYHRVHHRIPARYRGPAAAFVMHDEPGLPLFDDVSASPFQRGGTVAFSALQLAHYMGADPVVFVGQDFAFAAGRTHAVGSIYDRPYDLDAPPDDYIPVPGADGQLVITSRLHQAYLLHMQDYLLQLARAHDRTRHINTSRIGALIRGMEYLDLESALAGVEPADVAAADVLRRVLSGHTRIPSALQAETRERWAGELNALLVRLARVDSFEQALAEFARTSLYQHAGSGYEHLRYLAETRTLRGADEGALLKRFRQHLWQIAGELGQRLAVAA